MITKKVAFRIERLKNYVSAHWGKYYVIRDVDWTLSRTQICDSLHRKYVRSLLGFLSTHEWMELHKYLHGDVDVLDAVVSQHVRSIAVRELDSPPRLRIRNLPLRGPKGAMIRKVLTRFPVIVVKDIWTISEQDFRMHRGVGVGTLRYAKHIFSKYHVKMKQP